MKRMRIVHRDHWRSSSHPNSAKDSVSITLSCGCRLRYKGSKEPKGFAYCVGRCGRKGSQ